MSTLPVLVLGSRDPAVETLLSKLREHGAWSAGEAPESFTPAVEEAVRYFQQTHLGPLKKFLTADGMVGPDTWWALGHASGDAQRSNIQGSLPAGLSPLRTKLLTVALAEHQKGVVEKPNGSNRGPDIDKYLPGWITEGQKPGPPWCCFFYSWVVKEALGSYPLGGREGSCAKAREKAGELGLWIPKFARKGHPLPGDAFVLDHGGGTGHIGLVLRVSADGSQFNTIEGNCGNRVKLGLRELSDKELVGFIDNVASEQGLDFERGVLAGAGVAGDSTR